MNRINYFTMTLRMFISSYFPLYIILLILYNDKINNISKIKSILMFENSTVSIFIIILVIFCIISIFTCKDLKKTEGNENHKFYNIESTRDTIISYMMTYIVPILSINISDNKTIIINTILYILIGFMYIKLKLIYLNPLFLLCGYYMYNADNGIIIITNISCDEIHQLNGTTVKASPLGNKIYLIQKLDNLSRL